MAEDGSSNKQWTLAAVRDWADATFPDAFAALPDVQDIEFAELDDEMMKITSLRLPTNASKKVLRIGLWDGFSDNHHDRVFAYLHGEHHNQVGYIREYSDFTPRRYRRLQLRDMYCVDVEEPLCNISGGSERATLTRLRALVCYYFIAAGYYHWFGDFDSFTREFQRACLLIKDGSTTMLEDSQPEPSQPSSYSTSYSAAAKSNHEVSEAEPAMAKLEDLGEFRSDDTMDMASSPVRPHCRARPQAAKAPPLHDRSSVENMLQDINVAYTILEKGNKRLKLSITETRAKDTKLIATLQAENAKLKARNMELAASEKSDTRKTTTSLVAERDKMPKQTELDNEKNEFMLAKLHNVFKRRLAKVHDGVDAQTDRWAREKFGTGDMPATEISELRKQLREQTARADATEKKLAEIRDYVGQRH